MLQEAFDDLESIVKLHAKLAKGSYMIHDRRGVWFRCKSKDRIQGSTARRKPGGLGAGSYHL